MPSKKSRVVRKLPLPGRDFEESSVPVTKQGSKTWFRVHRAEFSPVHFSLRRHHRFSHEDCPYDVLYLASSIKTGLWEVFGDNLLFNERAISSSHWGGFAISKVTLPALRVCAVSQQRTRSAMGVEKSALLAADLSVPQAWGRAVQQHRAEFQALQYTSRFDDKPCLALFDRDNLADLIETKRVGSLHEADDAVGWLMENRVALVEGDF